MFCVQKKKTKFWKRRQISVADVKTTWDAVGCRSQFRYRAQPALVKQRREKNAERPKARSIVRSTIHGLFLFDNPTISELQWHPTNHLSKPNFQQSQGTKLKKNLKSQISKEKCTAPIKVSSSHVSHQINVTKSFCPFCRGAGCPPPPRPVIPCGALRHVSPTVGRVSGFVLKNSPGAVLPMH